MLHAGRWGALCVNAAAQLLTAVDATVVNIALPTARHDLGFSDADRQWVITAYTLAFAGLLLTGGRIADRVGRKRALLGALGGFAAASALAGAAPTFEILIVGRALQGACAAVLAPTALSLVAVLFTDRRERARAFATYGAVAGSGAIVGLIVGGALTQYAQWRWCLYVNVLFAVAVLVAGAAPVNASPDWTYCGLTSGCCSAATASPTPGIPWPTPPTTSSRVAPGCHWRFNGLGETLRLTGSIHEGRIQHADAPAVAVEIGNRYEQARAHDGIAIIDHATGDLGQARRHRQQALTLYTELDLPDADHLRAAIEFDATAPLKRC